MSEFTLKVINPEKPELGVRLSAYRCESFLLGVIEVTGKGYTLREGEVFSALTGYQANFDAPEVEGTITPEVEEVITPEPTKIMGVINMDITGARKISTQVVDVDRIKAMDGDRKLLDKYGEELGVKLNRSKTFKNMLKDLEKGLK